MKSELVNEFILKAKSKGWVLGLSSMYELLDRFDGPHNKIKVVHVAGTNGKGSVIAYVSSILITAGIKTGVYTSPAIESEYERYQINGENIPQEEYEELLLEIKAKCDDMEREGLRHPTLFEIETVLAILYFYRCRCDICILETGMGGRDDAVNVVAAPLISVFTSIGFDHMAYLGDTLPEIASVKAGIIKEKCDVISTWQTSGVEAVLYNRAKELGSNIYFLDKDELVINDDGSFTYDNKQYEISLKGAHQASNAVLAIGICKLLSQKGYKIREDHITFGLKHTKWPYRYDKISDNPTVILDGAHNFPAIIALKNALNADYKDKNLTFIIGCFADKAYEVMFEDICKLPKRIITVTPNNVRALPSMKLKETLIRYCRNTYDAISYQDAVAQALSFHSDAIVVFGSLSYLADIKQVFIKELEHENRQIPD